MISPIPKESATGDNKQATLFAHPLIFFLLKKRKKERKKERKKKKKKWKYQVLVDLNQIKEHTKYLQGLSQKHQQFLINHLILI